MYIPHDDSRRIPVPEPYRRVLTPYLMRENAPRPLDFSVHLCEWDPGDRNDMHSHAAETEAMFVLEGEGTATCGGEKIPLRKGGLLVAIPGVEHVIENTGREKLRLLCIFSPPASETGLRRRAAEAMQQPKEKA